MNGSPVDGYKVGGCAPLVWMVVTVLLVAGLIWVTKSLFPGILAGLILGSVVSQGGEGWVSSRQGTK